MRRILIVVSLIGVLLSPSYTSTIEKPLEKQEMQTKFAEAATPEEEVEATTVDPAEFPTPKPFLDEPESPVSDDPTRDFPNVPPNFDITQITEITGIKRDHVNDLGRYVGRAQCECGRPGGRIVGGEPTMINEYPWTAVLLRRSWLGTLSRTAYCGGTLINDRYVVTASHCVDGMTARGIVVSLHEEDQFSNTETESGVQRFDVEKIIMHPNYGRRNIDNDIALLKLAKPATLDRVIVPACLPANDNFTYDGVEATAAGWGATSEGGSISGVLRRVNVTVLTNNDCNTKTNYEGKITNNMLCAGDIDKGGKDSCQGDSGGPLVIENGGRRTLIGVVSWGYGCARPKSPGVYTRVSRYPEWILQNTRGAEWCQL